MTTDLSGTGADPAFRLGRDGFRRGMRDIYAAAIAVTLLGVAFGAAAIEAGLSAWAALFMSASVFAGASQYAVLEFWHAPLPLLAVVMTVFAVNARLIVMGATLAPQFGTLRPLSRYSALALLSDANWAATHKAVRDGERDLAHLVGGGFALWLAWVAGTAIGVFIGHALGDLGRYGIDAVMPVYFACLLVGFADNRRDMPPWIVAGVCSGGLTLWLPPQWAILTGAFIGAVYGTVRDARG